MIEERGPQLIEWPSNSPDLNIIEHVWARLKSEVRRILKSDSKEDLLVTISQAWDSCNSHRDIETLYVSMPKRIAACLKAKGGHTNY